MNIWRRLLNILCKFACIAGTVASTVKQLLVDFETKANFAQLKSLSNYKFQIRGVSDSHLFMISV